MNEFVLKNTETVPDGIKRIIASQADFALYNIVKNINKDFDESIHEARKCSKRIRAMLRLVRNETGNKLFKKENYHFRDINRLLSEIRNITVIIETLSKVINQNPGKDYSELVNETIRFKDRLLEVLFVEENRLKTVTELLNAGKERARALPLRRDSINILYKGMRRVYKLCEKCMKKAIKEPTDENLHEWRKKVKYLYYQFQVLTPFLPDELTTHIPGLDRMSEYLGEDHDMAELEIFLDNISGIYPADFGIDILEKSIRISRNDMQAVVFSSAIEVINKSTEKHINNLISNR